MIRPARVILPGLALAGFAVAAAISARSNPPIAEPAKVTEPAAAPFPSYLAAAGVVEATSRNVVVSPPLPGVAASVGVHPEQRVSMGDVLFRIDSRDLAASVEAKRAAVAAARAKAAEVEASMANSRALYRNAQAISDRRAMSVEEVETRRNAFLLDQARLRTAQADVATLEAQLRQAEVDVDRSIVRSPMDGTVLQVNLRAGEYAPVGSLSTPLVAIGSAGRLAIRCDIDENDAWRFRPGTRARAYLRGNPGISSDLRFEYFEPQVVPKQQLTGDSAERVDTRVLQAVYSFDPAAFPAYIGQQVDVFIETPAKLPDREPAR